MNQRRVLIITTAFPPSTCAGIHRIVRFARHLPEHGWQPSVLSEGTENGISRKLAAEFALPADLVVVRTRALGRDYGTCGSNGEAAAAGTATGFQAKMNHRPGSLRAIARNLRDLSVSTPDKDMAWTAASLRRALTMVRQLRLDVVLTSGPPHSTHLIGLAVKRLARTPWVADFRDPWARRPWGLKAENPWGQRLLGRIEQRCVRHADRIILNTEPMTTDFRDHYAEYDPLRFVTIPNACDPLLSQMVHELHQVTDRNDVVDSKKPVRLCHPGSLYRKRDPRPLLEAIGRLRQEGLMIEFEQIGSCDPSFALGEFVAEHELRNAVILDPPVPHTECLRRMALADLFVLIQPGTAIQVPGKLFEMMSFGKPILALTDEGATADVIRRHEIGVVARADDAGEIARAIRRATSRMSALTESRRWDRVRDEYDVGRTVRLLAGELDAVVDRNSRRVRPKVQEAVESYG